MRARLLALSLALAAGAGFLAAPPRPAAAQADPPPAAAPYAGPTWEYRVVLLEHEEYKQEPEYLALEKELKSPWRAQFAFHERVLTRAGAEGWEAVQVLVPKAPSSTILYLRRPGAAATAAK